MAVLTPQRPAPAPSELSGGTLPRWAPLACVGGAVAAALVLNVTTPVSGTAGTALVAAALFAIIQTVWSFSVEGRRHAVDRLATTLVYASAVVAIAPLVAILLDVVIQGLQAFSWDYLTTSMRNVSPRKEGGGIYHAIIGTLQQVGIAAVIGVPIGIMVGIYLVEYPGQGRLRHWVSFFVDVMTGVPSIVAGLFIYTWWVLTLGFERSGFAGSLALAILMIPVVVRSTEEMLRIVPNELREASYALGVPKYRTIMKIVLPTALTGIITGVMLAIARVAGETAPLLLTTFLSQSINYDPFSGPQASIPTFIWDQIASGTDASLARAWAGALTLILLIIALNVTARLLARRSRVR